MTEVACEKHDFIGAIVASDKLAPSSKHLYLKKLRSIMAGTGHDLLWIVRHPKESLEWIRKATEHHTSQKTYVTCILVLFKYCEGLKIAEKTAHGAWAAAFEELEDAIEKRYKQNAPTKRQQEGYVPFADIVAKRDSLDAGSRDRLLLAMYTHIPPLRADFNRVRIFETAAECATVAAGAEPNYIVMSPKARLVLQEYKTKKHNADKKYEKDLPKVLVDEIRASLKKVPRDYLFMCRDGTPYSAETYTKWANQAFKRLFGKPLTISLIRHSYINTLDMNTLTIAEKEAIAQEMAHTVETQDRYRLIFPKKPALSAGAVAAQVTV